MGGAVLMTPANPRPHVWLLPTPARVGRRLSLACETNRPGRATFDAISLSLDLALPCGLPSENRQLFFRSPTGLRTSERVAPMTEPQVETDMDGGAIKWRVGGDMFK